MHFKIIENAYWQKLSCSSQSTHQKPTCISGFLRSRALSSHRTATTLINFACLEAIIRGIHQPTWRGSSHVAAVASVEQKTMRSTVDEISETRMITVMRG